MVIIGSKCVKDGFYTNDFKLLEFIKNGQTKLVLFGVKL